MNRLTILALPMLVSSAVLFSGCVVPADSYYSDPYYQSNVTVVPALPYTVTLYEQPYYNYHGYYYFYNSQRWYYSRTKGGNWIALPRTHWPSDTRWKGRHFNNDHRDHKYDGHDQRPSKDPKYPPPKAAPRGNDNHRQKKDPHPRDPRYNNKYQQKTDSRYKTPTHPPQNKKHQDGKKRIEEETRSSEPEFKRR